eukprot:69156_1
MTADPSCLLPIYILSRHESKEFNAPNNWWVRDTQKFVVLLFMYGLYYRKICKMKMYFNGKNFHHASQEIKKLNPLKRYVHMILKAFIISRLLFNNYWFGIWIRTNYVSSCY